MSTMAIRADCRNQQSRVFKTMAVHTRPVFDQCLIVTATAQVDLAIAEDGRAEIVNGVDTVCSMAVAITTVRRQFLRRSPRRGRRAVAWTPRSMACAGPSWQRTHDALTLAGSFSKGGQYRGRVVVIFRMGGGEIVCHEGVASMTIVAVHTAVPMNIVGQC